MGDTNEIHLGEGASAKQVVAGRNNTLTNIEQQINYYGARPSIDARFSLPTPPRDFTGRSTEIEMLVQQLTQGQRAAIAGVAGMGGVGKTALALVVAERVAAQFPDGRLWVELRGTDEPPTKPSDAMRRVILAFEASADLSKADDAALAQIYRGVLQGKRVLIVLDNAADNVQIRPLLQADAAFLVTARASLTEGGLRLLRLDVMQEPDAHAYLLAQVPRMTAADTDALAEVCGYLPLALKIAASHLAARSNVKPATYLTQLRERRLELLRERDDPELNVEAAFGLSYNQLTPDLQLLWRVLGVFPAPFWGNAAQFVWGVESEGLVESALGELLRESLIEYDEKEDKYRLHDLLREFANRRMTDDERRMAEKRYAEFYKNVAIAAYEIHMEGGENVVAGLKLLDQELVHIQAGQKWAGEHLETDEDAARLCIRYIAGMYLIALRLSAREQMRWLEDGVNAAHKLGDKAAEGNALGSLGNVYRNLGEVQKAIEYYEQALAVVREIGDRAAEGPILGNLGIAYKNLGQVRRAIEYYEQVLVIAREMGERRAEGAVLGNLGVAYRNLGEVRKAIEYFEQRLVIALEIGDRRGEGAVLGNLGLAYADLGEVQKAIEYHQHALLILQEIGDRRGEGNALGNLGLAYADLGEVQKAIEYYEQALVMDRQIGNRHGEGLALGNLGIAYADLGELQKAIGYFEQALVIAREIGNRRGEGDALGNLGSAYADSGELEKAIEYYEQRLVIAQEIGDRGGEGNALANMGSVYEQLDDMERAKELWQEALEIYVAIEDPNAEKVRGWLEGE